MSKPKLYVTGVRKDKGRDVVVTQYREPAVPCKECKKEPRQMHSSRCKTCSDKHAFAKADQDRLQAKIKKQLEESKHE